MDELNRLVDRQISESQDAAQRAADAAMERISAGARGSRDLFSPAMSDRIRHELERAFHDGGKLQIAQTIQMLAEDDSEIKKQWDEVRAVHGKGVG